MIKVTIQKYPEGREVVDVVACERALMVDLVYGPAHHRKHHRLTTTMRTPGQDRELVMGWLFTLGIIDKQDEIADMAMCSRNKLSNKDVDKITVYLHVERSYLPADVSFSHARYSSCGLCGIYDLPSVLSSTQCDVRIRADLLLSMGKAIAREQPIFCSTGGTHGAAVFDVNSGDRLALFEDVGRHNALDKLIGHMLLQGAMPKQAALILTSRASFEMVQKAARAHIKIVAAMGAVSSLAVHQAELHDITLVGFLRPERFNIYSHSSRIITD